jgi:hypothetical protein
VRLNSTDPEVYLLLPGRAKKDSCVACFFFNHLDRSADMPGKQPTSPDSIRVVSMDARTFPFHKLCRHNHERYTILINAGQLQYCHRVFAQATNLRPG